MSEQVKGLGTLLRELLHRLDDDAQRLYDEIGAPFRPRFYPVAQLLRDGAALGTVELAHGAGVSQPAMTQTLNEMRKLGLIEDAPGQDRRSRAVRLSPAGRDTVAALTGHWDAIARAAAEIERETGLRTALEGAIAALDRRSFSHRIKEIS